MEFSLSTQINAVENLRFEMPKRAQLTNTHISQASSTTALHHTNKWNGAKALYFFGTKAKHNTKSQEQREPRIKAKHHQSQESKQSTTKASCRCRRWEAKHDQS
jgi:hypothetical protein